MSFANEFKRARKGIDEEIAYYRSFIGLDGPDNDSMAQSIEVLEELRDKWDELSARFEGRGRMPSRPFDWDEDRAARGTARESMNKIIKAAAAAEQVQPHGVGPDKGLLPPSADV